MKKKLLLCLLPAFLLTGCNISFLREEKKEGYEDGYIGVKKVEYFTDAEVATMAAAVEELKDITVSHVLTFEANTSNGQPELKTKDDVLAITNDEDEVITNVSKINNVNQFHGLKVGHASEYSDGSIQFEFNVAIKAISIVARPRANVVSSGPAMTTIIDKNIAMNVNNSKYIKINSDFEKMDDIVDTKLLFTFDSTSTINLNVVYQRAEIMQITLYE